VENAWRKSYPQDVPYLIDPEQFSSVVSLIDAACEEFPKRPAFANFGSFMSFAEFDRHADAFAAYLQNVALLKPGDRVALMMPNMLAYPVALLGVLRAGGVAVNTNPLYTAHELSHQLQDSGARIIVAFEHALATVSTAVADLAPVQVVVTHLGDFMAWPKAQIFNRVARRRASVPIARIANSVTLLQAIGRGRSTTLTRPQIAAQDLAFLQYTGGTTGRAKGAMLSHRNIVANILQVSAWFGGNVVRGHEIIITALPLYHIYALTGNYLTFLAHGGLNYLISDPRDLKTFVKEIKRVPFTTISGVNTLFNALLHHPDFASVDFSHLKFSSAGGIAVQRSVAEHWQRVTGSVLAEGYGLTETSPVVAANRFDLKTFSGCIGLPLPSTEVRIVDDKGGVLGIDEPGELHVRGPQVMQGYWNNPQETARAIDADGWLGTGDVAILREDGYLRIVDRKKDLILVSGFNVYPNEVEDVAVAQGQVHEAAAIGISDSKSGEAVRLVVVRTDPVLDAETLLTWMREHLTGYKVPRSVVFVDELPKSTVGKILRREVRALHGNK
jgi:long-chain acyl-CoA synthetase